MLRVQVPPPRQRQKDIPLLCEHFARKAGGHPGWKLSDRAKQLLVDYAWPGNVRELENEVRRWVARGLCEVTATQLSDEIREGKGVARAQGDLSGRTLGDVERQLVEAAMKACAGNKSKAARQLGIPRTSLYHLIRRYEME